MRVISGIAKGRRLVSFRGEGIRPTADRVKEALFNIITANFGSLDGKRVLDLFAGTGNLGIEALSRGAERAVFIDEASKSARVIKRNIELCGFTAGTLVMQVPVETGIRLLSKKDERFDLVFLDPPYEKRLVGKTLKAIAKAGIMEAGGIAVAEHSQRERPSEGYNGLTRIDRRGYGDTEVSFYQFEQMQSEK